MAVPAHPAVRSSFAVLTVRKGRSSPGIVRYSGTVRGCLRFSGSIIVLPHEEISNDLKDIAVHISDSGRRVLRSKDKDILKPQQEQSPQAKKPKKRGMER